MKPTWGAVATSQYHPPPVPDYAQQGGGEPPGRVELLLDRGDSITARQRVSAYRRYRRRRPHGGEGAEGSPGASLAALATNHRRSLASLAKTSGTSSCHSENVPSEQAACQDIGARIGITVEEALKLPCLTGARVLAGHQGVHRRIRVVNIMEVPDIVRWMRGGELLLTTAYPVRENPEALTRLVPQLFERGLAGLGIRIGPYMPAPPPGMLAVADRLGFPVIEIPDGTTFNDILSEVLSTILNRQAVALERSQAIHEKLTAVAVDGGSFQDLMETLADLLQRRTAIIDPYGDTVAAAGPEPDEAEFPTVCYPIQVGTAIHGEVVVWPGKRPMLPHELIAAERAATIAALVTAQERAVADHEQRYRTVLLLELVTGQSPDRSDIVRRAATIGWDLHLPRAAVLIELGKEPGASGGGRWTEEPLVRAAQEAAGPTAIVCALQSGLAMLVEPGQSLAGVCLHVYERLHESRQGLQVMTGAGRICADPSGLPRSYREAVETLALGRDIYGPDFVLQHSELGIYRLLCQLPQDELHRHVQEMLGPLLAYDRHHHGCLVQTLETYLRHDRNGMETARELYIHYHTLRYRMEQIDRLTEGIGRHPANLLCLEVAVHAHRLLRARLLDDQRGVPSTDPDAPALQS